VGCVLVYFRHCQDCTTIGEKEVWVEIERYRGREYVY
jgi:hypothetical protein